MKHPFLILARCVFVRQTAVCPTKTLAPKGEQSLRSRDNRPMEKQKQNNHNDRCATCPRWDRWHIRIPNSEDQQKLIRLYRKSGAKTKSDFVRARLLGESFKVITQDPAKEPYLEKLSEIVALAHKIGVLYNEVVKVLNTYHSVATAQQLLGKLETYSQILIRLQQQAVQLTKSFGSREE